MLWTSKIGGRKAIFSATGLRPVQKRLALLRELLSLVEEGKIKKVKEKVNRMMKDYPLFAY